MNAVGIDVSKGKSTVAILRPFGEIVASPFDVIHSPSELNKLVTLIKSLKGETKCVLEFTGNYYLPIAKALHDAHLFVSVVNPILVKDYGSKSIRKVKTDKKDALKLASFALDRWLDLNEFSSINEIRSLLKSYSRQYEQYISLKVKLKNNLVSLLDRSFPNINSLFNNPTRSSDGHEKWIDFVFKFPHAYSVSKKTFFHFSKSYLSWCRKCGYYFSEITAQKIYDFACNCFPTLPFNESTTFLISQAVIQINGICETLASLAKEMNKLASLLPEYDTVMSMFGVGQLLGSQLIAEIGDISRFTNKKALVAFAGLDSPPCQSGTFQAKSHAISKRGSPALRKTLFQIMRVILLKSPPDNTIFQFLDKKRAEGKNYFVFMIAAANKFLRIYYARVSEHIKVFPST